MAQLHMLRRLFDKYLPWVFLGLMGAMWGLSFSLGKIAVDAGIKPFGISQFQATVSGLILLVITLIRRKPLGELKDKFGFILVIAILGAAVPGVLFYLAAGHVQAGVLAITVALIPLLTYGASIPLRIEAFNKIRFLGLVFGVVAILFIALPENSLPDRAALPWILLACVSSVCYALENIILGFKSAVTIGAIRMSMGMNLLAGVLLLPFTIYTDSLYIPALPLEMGDLAVFGLAIISVVAYTMFVMSVAKFGAVFASQTGYLVTLAGVLWGILIFGESHSVWVWFSLVCMIIGLALVNPKKEA